MNDAGQRVAIDVEQTSSVGKMLWLGFWTALLAIPTLTLFRFWARTLFRAQLWRETKISGEPLEYVGKGSELFLGFLIAIFTVGLPLAIAIVAVQFFLPLPLGLVVFAVIYLGLFVLIFVAMFLSRRYILSRTMWRGVRFSMTGSPMGFGLVAFGYMLLTILTLGWFAPVMRLRLARRMWGSTLYGDLPFQWDDSRDNRTEPVWASFALAWFGGVIAYAAIFGLAFALGMHNPEIAMDPNAMMRSLGLFYLGLFAVSLLLVFFIAWHEAVMLRQITKSIGIGDVRLGSRLKAMDLIELTITNLLLIVVTLGFGALAAQMRVWRRIARRIETSGALDAARIAQAANRGPGHGEGMADTLDISGGF